MIRRPVILLVLGLLPLAVFAADKNKQKDPSCTEESLDLVQDASVCFDHWDYGCAALKLETALKHQPSCAEALWVKSFLVEHNGDRPGADALRAQALKINPQLSDFWEERAHDIEAHLTTQEFSHFIVSFDGAEDRDRAWQVLSNLDSAYNELGSRFGEFPAAKISVIVFSSPEFMDAWKSPFIGGFFDQRDGKVRVRMDDVPGGDDAYGRITRHEFTHAFMNQYFPLKNLPLWFVEGTAQFYAYFNPDDVFWEDKRLEEIRKQRQGYPFLSFHEIEEAIGRKRVSAGMVYLAYLQSEALVLQIAKDRGDSWVYSVMTDLRKGMTFEAAFMDVVGILPSQEMNHLQHAWE